MLKAEYLENKGYLQSDSAEREEYAGARSIDNRETEEADGADLLERILDRENLNRAYERVKANKGAPGIDGMTVEDAYVVIHDLSAISRQLVLISAEARQGLSKVQ